MRALLLTAPGTLALDDIDLPRPGPGEVVIDVEATGFGGSETMALKSPGLRRLPNVMGHGICGVTKAGQRVAVFPLSSCQRCSYCQQGLCQLCSDWRLLGVQAQGGFAEQVAVPANALVELPDSVSWEQASFIEPFANSVNAWERARPKPADSILIVGAGSLGLGIAAMAKAQGHNSVMVSDLSASRRNAALELGATEAAEQVSGEFDIVFDTVGSQRSRTSSIDQTRRNGKTVFLGFAEQSGTMDFSKMIREQKTFIGSFVFSEAQFKKAIPLARNCQSEWVTNLSFSEVAEALVAYAEGQFEPVKSVLRPRQPDRPAV